MKKYFTCIILFLFMFCGKSLGETQQDLQARGVPAVTAEELSQAFDDNPIAALDRYREVMLTGKIKTIGIARTGELYIGFGIWRKSIFISCYFDKKKRNELSILKKGQSVTLYAYMQDYVIENRGSITMTQLRMINCSIVDANPLQQK